MNTFFILALMLTTMLVTLYWTKLRRLISIIIDNFIKKMGK